MSERVSNTDIRLRIRLCENSLGRGGPHHMALLDLLDARRERDEARKALRWLAGAYAGMRDQPEAPKYVIATVRAAIAAARAAGGGEDE